MSRFLASWLPVVAWAGLIFLLSSQPDLPHGPEGLLDILVRKGGHVLEYAVLAWLLLRALWTTSQQAPGGPYLYAVGLALLYALSDEYHQSLIPLRSPSSLDVAIDTAGAAAALMISWMATRGSSQKG